MEEQAGAASKQPSCSIFPVHPRPPFCLHPHWRVKGREATKEQDVCWGSDRACCPCSFVARLGHGLAELYREGAGLTEQADEWADKTDEGARRRTIGPVLVFVYSLLGL